MPESWAEQSLQWRVLDTHWRGGQRFLAAWAAWRADLQRPRLLHYIALQAAPDSVTDNPALNAQLWGLLPGLHRIALDGGQVLLTLCVGGEPQNWLRQQGWTADTLFLDGLSVDNHTAKALARNCRRGTQLIALNCAGDCAAWLERSGFALEPPSADVLRATYQPRWELRTTRTTQAPPATPARCLVIGAGLSGAATAASLARRGWQVRVLDAAAQPAAGASGLPAGVFAPYASLDDSALSRISRSGVRAMLEYAAPLLQAGVDWQPNGVLEQRLDQPFAPLADWSQPASLEQLRAAGLPDDTQACWHPHGGWLRPARLVTALLAQPGITWQANAQVAQLQHSDGVWRVVDAAGALLAEAELVVLAAGTACNALLHSAHIAPLPLQPVRGQLSWGVQPASSASQLPPFAVNGHGGLVAQVPSDTGLAWHMGSTFERDINYLPPSAAEQAAAHTSNWQQLQTLLPSAAAALHTAFDPAHVRAWASVRCTAPDRMPLVGAVTPDLPNLWVCTAMGARGLSCALLCGELLAAQLHGEPLPLEARLARALSMERLGTFKSSPAGAPARQPQHGY